MARRRERSAGFWRGAIIVMIFGVLAAFGYIAMNRPPALDEQTACRLDRRDPSHTVLLVDQSDPFAPTDFGWVYDLLDSESRSLPQYGRITLMTLNSAAPYEPKELFTKCSPGSPEEVNPFIQNPVMVEDNWRRQLYEPLKARVTEMLKETTQKASPIMEAVYTIADRPDFQPRTPMRKLIIVSDLIQNSDQQNFYRTKADYAQFEKSAIAAQQPRLKDVTVIARVVPRQKYDLPVDALYGFWKRYVESASAVFKTTN